MLPIQTVDGKYRVERLLGKGGMGAVYEARHLGTGRRVAVKVIVCDTPEKADDDVRRFQREARAAGAIESQHIAQVLDTGVDPSGFPYIVIEYLDGEDLSKAMTRLGPFPPEVALRVVSQACAGLHKAHLANVIHRDIKPANLYLARQDGNEVIVKILDFGIAKITIDHVLSTDRAVLTTTGMTLGSPLYMSPEQARGAKDVDHRSDIWSLGIVLYECLSGTTPHAKCASFGELILAICGEHHSIQDAAPWVAREVAAIVDKALAIDPARRFQSASEMGAAIRDVLNGGHAIDESTLVPLAPDVRASTAPRSTASMKRIARREAVTAPVLARRGDDAFTTSTPIASTKSPPAVPVPRQRSRVSVTLVSLLVLGSLFAVGGIGFRVHRASMHETPADSDPSVVSRAPLAVDAVSSSSRSDPYAVSNTAGSSQANPSASPTTSAIPTIHSPSATSAPSATVAPIPRRVPPAAPARPASSASAPPSEPSTPCRLVTTYDKDGNPHFTCPCSICQ